MLQKTVMFRKLSLEQETKHHSLGDIDMCVPHSQSIECDDNVCFRIESQNT